MHLFHPRKRNTLVTELKINGNKCQNMAQYTIKIEEKNYKKLYGFRKELSIERSLKCALPITAVRGSLGLVQYLGLKKKPGTEPQLPG